VRKLSGADLVVVTLMTVIPTLFVLVPRLVPGDRLGAAVVHQLERHRPAQQIKGIGFTNYVNVATNYPPFWPALAPQPDVPRGPLPHRDADRDVPRGAAGQGDAVQPLLPDRDLPAGRAEPGPRSASSGS
jgi:hypothetical protein